MKKNIGIEVDSAIFKSDVSAMSRQYLIFGDDCDLRASPPRHLLPVEEGSDFDRVAIAREYYGDAEFFVSEYPLPGTNEDNRVESPVEISDDGSGVRIRILVDKDGVPCLDGEYETIARLSYYTFQDALVVDRLIEEVYDPPKSYSRPPMESNRAFYSSQNAKVKERDAVLTKPLILRRCLISWDLFPDLKRNTSWVADEDWKKIIQMPGILPNFLISEFCEYETATPDNADWEKQAAALFSPNSKGVSDPLEEVVKYCTFGNFGEKFHAPFEQVLGLRFKDYAALKFFAAKQSESMMREIESAKSKRPVSRAGGRAGQHSKTIREAM